MTDKMIFLSHIHEEKSLAVLIKNALTTEFSGFVDVFVSSDGTSIPAGSNFLKRIEDGLVTCIGAIYLISPISVKRNWINFELGAVWVRNVISLRSGGPEIPTLPLCHSGMTPSSLPAPLNNLNAVLASQSSQLQFAFQSLQSAVGGKGALKTSFDGLALQVIDFERTYTIGASLKRMLSLLAGDIQKLIDHCKTVPAGNAITIQCGFVGTTIIQALKGFESNELKGSIAVAVTNPGMSFGPMGAVNGAEVAIQIPASLVLQYANQLLA